jgi:hypothetical protein
MSDEHLEIILNGTFEEFCSLMGIIDMLDEDSVNELIGQVGKEMYWQLKKKVWEKINKN